MLKLDKRLNLGYETILKMIQRLDISQNANILDIGCDKGQLLKEIKTLLNLTRHAKLFGLDIRSYESEEIKFDSLNFEDKRFPYESNIFDLVICNQVLEHLKSYMWTLSEMIRITRINGYMILGVPNLASAHNRILLLLGRQPTTLNLIGPHVRGFTPHALIKLLEKDQSMTVVDIRGSNFYPFPPAIAKKLASVFPTFAVSTFLVIKKNKDYDFLMHWKKQKLATNFYLGQ